MKSIKDMLIGREASLTDGHMVGGKVKILDVEGSALVSDSFGEMDIHLSNLLLRAEGLRCFYHEDVDADLVILDGDIHTPVCLSCAQYRIPKVFNKKSRSSLRVVGGAVMRVPPNTMADCACATWAYSSSQGEWPEGGHHPNCNATHDKDKCECPRCERGREPFPVILRAFSERRED